MMCQALKQMLREYYFNGFDLHIELGHKKKKRLNHDMIVQKISSSWSQLMLCWKSM